VRRPAGPAGPAGPGRTERLACCPRGGPPDLMPSGWPRSGGGA